MAKEASVEPAPVKRTSLPLSAMPDAKIAKVPTLKRVKSDRQPSPCLPSKKTIKEKLW